MKKNKGFTLIELLAIIVILAIIAVITVPIILNVIDNAKKGSIKDSAYGYKDAINKLYVSKLSEDLANDLTGVFTPETLKSKGLNVSGQEPVDGWIFVEKGTVLDYSLKFDDYIVDYDKTSDIPIVTKNGELKESVTYYYGANAKEIYFDPVNGIYCKEDEYHKDNSLINYNGTNSTKTTENQTTCLKWWAYSEDSKGINMISDHNMSDNLPWITRDEYEALGGEVLADLPGCQYGRVCARQDKGPGESLKNTLYTIADNWSDILIRKDKYSINGLINDDNRTVDYTIDYNGYKARFISAEEIASITGADKPYPDGMNWKLDDLNIKDAYYLDGSRGTDPMWSKKVATAENKSNYAWLYNYTNNHSHEGCIEYGCDTDDDVVDSTGGNVFGYWTGSAKIGSNYGTPWGICAYGATCSGPADAYSGTDKIMGIRTVITVPKNI